MRSPRHRVLVGLLAGFVVLNLAILWGLLPTIFFGITVAYILVPLTAMLRGRGYSRYFAAVISTVVAGLGALLLVVPILGVLYLRRQQIIAALRSIPEEIVLDFGEFSYLIETNRVIKPATSYLTELAFDIAAGLPVLTAKALVFLFVVFGLLVRGEELSEALLSAIPDAHHSIVWSLHDRSRQTLYALYITQAATGLATSLVALPVFVLFGYGSPFTLALIAGILQFLPVIGPSILVLLLVGFELMRGAVLTATLLLVVGLVLIGFLPDALIRPRLASQTAHLPSSLYFVGFTGGVLSLGAVGIIAGPLAVALLVETVALLGDEEHPNTAETNS